MNFCLPGCMTELSSVLRHQNLYTMTHTCKRLAEIFEELAAHNIFVVESANPAKWSVHDRRRSIYFLAPTVHQDHGATQHLARPNLHEGQAVRDQAQLCPQHLITSGAQLHSCRPADRQERHLRVGVNPQALLHANRGTSAHLQEHTCR